MGASYSTSIHPAYHTTKHRKKSLVYKPLNKKKLNELASITDFRRDEIQKLYKNYLILYREFHEENDSNQMLRSNNSLLLQKDQLLGKYSGDCRHDFIVR